MTVETTSNVSGLSGMNAGLENKSQGVTASDGMSGVFTVTLKEQFQLLNGVQQAVSISGTLPDTSAAQGAAVQNSTPLIVSSSLPGIDLQSTALQNTTPIDVSSSLPSIALQSTAVQNTRPLDTMPQTLPALNAALTPSMILSSLPTTPPAKAVPPQTAPALQVINQNTVVSNTLQQSLESANQANRVEITTLTNAGQETSALLGKPLPTAKKLEKGINLEETLQTLAEIMARIPDVASASDPSVSGNLSLSPSVAEASQASDAAATTTTDLVSNQDNVLAGLLQAGLLQPPVQNTPEPAPGKLDILPDNLTSNTLPNATLQIAPEAKKAADTTVISAYFTEPALNNAVAVKEGSAQKNLLTPALDNLNTALDTSTSKTLPAVMNDIAAFERQTAFSSPGKVDAPPMSAHLYSPEWNKELGSKIIWMTNQNISSAELKLNPQHLGPISIHIDMQKDQATVSFTAQNAGVKEMLEASIPKLREMMQSQQLNLAEVSVSQNTFSGQGQSQNPTFGQSNDGQKPATPEQDGAGSQRNDVANHIEQSRTLVSNGLVNFYA
ncbi:MAG: flagellar hook-length control protein FliK [Methylococcaceae bacterium]